MSTLHKLLTTQVPLTRSGTYKAISYEDLNGLEGLTIQINPEKPPEKPPNFDSLKIVTSSSDKKEDKQTIQHFIPTQRFEVRAAFPKKSFVHYFSKILVDIGRKFQSREQKKIEKKIEREAASIQQAIDEAEKKIVLELKDLNTIMIRHSRNYSVLKQELLDLLQAQKADTDVMVKYGHNTNEFEKAIVAYLNNILITADNRLEFIVRNVKNSVVIINKNPDITHPTPVYGPPVPPVPRGNSTKPTEEQEEAIWRNSYY